MLDLFKRLFAPSPVEGAARALYSAAVTQARQEVFFTDLEVPDTIDGRFDMVVLHVYLLLARLCDRDEDHRMLQTRLQEVLFADMDRALREMGVGDLSVGKHIKKMASAYFGRLNAYDAALDDAEPHPPTLEDALVRNVWRGTAPEPKIVARLANYVRDQRVHLCHQDIAAIEAGKVDFLPLKQKGAPDGRVQPHRP